MCTLTCESIRVLALELYWNFQFGQQVSLCLHCFKRIHKKRTEIILVNVRVRLRVAHFGAELKVGLDLHRIAVRNAQECRSKWKRSRGFIRNTITRDLHCWKDVKWERNVLSPRVCIDFILTLLVERSVQLCGGISG